MVPPPPYDRMMWDTIVKKYSSSMTVLRQIHAALTPDMYHLAVHPGEKVWRNPAAVPDLLGTPERDVSFESQPIARSREELREWNSQLEEANSALEALLEAQPVGLATQKSSMGGMSRGNEPEGRDSQRIARLLTLTSRQRAQEDSKSISTS